ncbi:MAG: polysaccharide deacetylase family protein [Candidatus Krumholzibacteriota bacterium]|nr:polysaccharide deacetylase family protein [Candidatus Krumholzibacteriota bacterium]
MKKRHLLGNMLSIIPFKANRFFRLLHRGEYLTVLCYHRILDIPADFPFDRDLVSASVDQFAGQLAFISSHFRVINFRMLKEHLDKYRKFPPNSLIITFDDGYVDNFEVAYPLLKKFGLTATMFATAGFIGQKKMFWWDKIAYLIKTTAEGSLELDTPERFSLDLERFADRQEAARLIIKQAKHLREEEKEGMIAEMVERLRVEIDEERYRLAMTWDQLRELNDNGIEIGAHSVSHPIFSNIDEDRLRREVNGAKEMIENQLQTEVITFGAPGRGILTPPDRQRFTTLLTQTVKGSGYSFSTMYHWGLAYERDFDPYRIERLGIETHDTERSFRAKLSYPEILVY